MQHVFEVLLRHDHRAGIVGADQVAGAHAVAAELHFDLVAAEAAAVADRAADVSLAVDRQIQGAVLVDVARDAVDHAAGQPALFSRGAGHATEGVDLRVAAEVDHQYVTRMRIDNRFQGADHRRLFRLMQWHQFHRRGRADDFFRRMPEWQNAARMSRQFHPVQAVGNVRRRQLHVFADQARGDAGFAAHDLPFEGIAGFDYIVRLRQDGNST